MKKKLPWLKYDMKKATYQEAKKQEDDAKLKLNEAAKALNDLTVPIEWVKLIDHSFGCILLILEWTFICFVTLDSFGLVNLSMDGIKVANPNLILALTVTDYINSIG